MSVPQQLQLIVLIPVMEEICFRGFILGIFLQRGRPLLGILVSTVLFAAYHPGFIETLIVGTLFGFMYWHTRQLSLVIIAHVVHNTVVTIATQCLQIEWVLAPVWWFVGLPIGVGCFWVAAWSVQQLPNQRRTWSQPREEG